MRRQKDWTSLSFADGWWHQYEELRVGDGSQMHLSLSEKVWHCYQFQRQGVVCVHGRMVYYHLWVA